MTPGQTIREQSMTQFIVDPMRGHRLFALWLWLRGRFWPRPSFRLTRIHIDCNDLIVTDAVPILVLLYRLFPNGGELTDRAFRLVVRDGVLWLEERRA